MKLFTAIDYMIAYMADGGVYRIADIARGIQKLGFRTSISGQYNRVASELLYRPDLFEKVGRGQYRLINKTRQYVDLDEARELIMKTLRKRGAMTASQMWRALVSQGSAITYQQVYVLLTKGDFARKDKSEYTLIKQAKYSNL